MPSEIQNIQKWENEYDWSKLGDEWSTAWGGTENLFWWMLFPRIKKFLKVDRVLEVAPGYGRITQYLKNFCDELIIVDISQNCIDACKNRFKNSNNIKYYVNDGKSLEMVEDESIDFIFSFDSLVHCEKDIVRDYLNQFSKKLKQNGQGFIHHSNLGTFVNIGKYSFKIFPPGKVRNHWRAKSMSAKLFKQFCKEANLSCYSQELINWGGNYLIDSFSVFEKERNAKNFNYNMIRNYDFMNEANYIKKISKIY